MRRPYLFISLVLVLGCRPNTGRIEIGDYAVDLPEGFKVEKGKAFNTETGIIKGQGITLHYEFSDHTRAPVLTPQEFIEQGEWKPAVARDLLDKGLEDVHKIEFLATRRAGAKDSTTCQDCDYLVNGRYDSLAFEAPIYLPLSTKQSLFLLDTFDNIQHKIFLAKDPGKGITGVYLKRITPEGVRVNNFYALSMIASGLTKGQQDTLVRLFLTAHYVPAK